MGSLSNTDMPCAGCKHLHRRCTKDCILLPYFPPSEPEKFAAIHRIFGASNISKMLQVIPISCRGDTVSSLFYEANARLKDPVYGCVASIASLQSQVSQLQTEFAVALEEILTLRLQSAETLSISTWESTRTIETEENPSSGVTAFTWPGLPSTTCDSFAMPWKF